MKKDKVQVKSSSHRSAKVDHIPKSEWYFEQVPDHLVHHCWLWEFCRELFLQNQELRGAVEAYWRKENAQDDWRRHVKHECDWPNVSGSEVFLEENIRWREPVLDDQEGTGSKWRVFTRLELTGIGDSIQHLPGWDDIRGYASTPDEVVLRLMDFDETFGLERDFADQLGIASVHESDRLIFCVDWNKADADLLKGFRLFIKEKRPNPLKPIKRKGRKQTPQRNDLRALGALRLLRHYGTQPNTMDALIERRKAREQINIPYSAQSNWTEAKQTAEKALSDFVRNAQYMN